MPPSEFQECENDGERILIPTIVIEGTTCVLMSEVEYCVPGAYRLEHNKRPIQFVLAPNYEHSHPRRIKYQADSVLTIAKKPRTSISESESSDAQVNLNSYQEAIQNLNSKDKAEIIAKIHETLERSKRTRSQNEDTQDQSQRAGDQNEKTQQRRAFIEAKMSAILTKNCELHEFPIPRMFIILPVNRHPANRSAILTTEYRLYFLCECGEHTESKVITRNSKYTIHIAFHEGYAILKPKEFFTKYGLYMLYLLRALRFGLQVGDISIPAFSQRSRSNRTLKKMIDVTEKTLDAAIEFLSSELANASLRNNAEDAGVSNEENLRRQSILEEADLRHVDTFIRRNDKSKVLGNLYRITTEKGHVKWVCLSHYRIHYDEAAENQLRNIINVHGGNYDDHFGRVVVTLKSGVLVKNFSVAITQARKLQELDITLLYNWHSIDLKALDNAIRSTTIGSLTLDVSRRDLTGLNERANALRNVMSNTRLKIIQLRVDEWFVENGLSSIRNLSHVKILNFKQYSIEDYSIQDDRGRKWLESMSAVVKVCPSLERMIFQNIILTNNSAMSLTKLFDNFRRLVDHGCLLTNPRDILIDAGLSVMEEITDLALYRYSSMVDILERESRNGPMRLKKLELTCESEVLAKEVEKIALFLERLKLSYLELSVGDCNASQMLQKVDYSMLTAFNFTGTFTEAVWRILDGGLKDGSTVEELSLSSRDATHTDTDTLPRIISRLSLRSLHIHNCRGTSDEEWAIILHSMEIFRLECLDISFTQLGDESVNRLIDRLSEAQTLSHLVLYRTQTSEAASNNLRIAIKNIQRNIVYQSSLG
ncbi:hypothetical protein K7432_004051 [Basidiobolus ranarum]|uniref:RNI-like protein n=1 Tax=Basidiobolus ranarum TaxID=34480 RepID=A0ABR2WYY6_9FUNG